MTGCTHRVYTCNTATLEAEFGNGVGSIPVGGNNPSISWWIVGPLVILHKKRTLTKYWDLSEKPNSELRFQVGLNDLP